MPYKAIVFWWNNACRSVMPFFRECAAIGEYRVRVVVEEALDATRTKMGWTVDLNTSFQLDVLPPDDWQSVSDRILGEEKDSLHVFGGYLSPTARRYAALRAARLGVPYCVMAESPLNMESGLRKLAKELYLRWGVPRKGRGIIEKARHLFCLSGERIDGSIAAGWPIEKVRSFGYFPEPQITGESLAQSHDALVRIISMGYLSHYKGNHVLLDALAYLNKANREYVCEIVGSGDQADALKRQAEALGISHKVNFHGFVSDPDLKCLLARSDILVCPGLDEPWGIRINEGIHLGMAVVASDRLGASDVLNHAHCGEVFRSGCAGELYLILDELISNREKLVDLKNRAKRAGHLISPSRAAKYFLEIVSDTNDQAKHPIAVWH